MIIAAVLFVIGVGIGCRYTVFAVLLASGFVAIGFVGVWARIGELDAVKALILTAYLSALQAGYVLGSYLTTPDEPG